MFEEQGAGYRFGLCVFLPYSVRKDWLGLGLWVVREKSYRVTREPRDTKRPFPYSVQRKNYFVFRVLGHSKRSARFHFSFTNKKKGGVGETL